MVSEPEERDKNLNEPPIGLKEILAVFQMAMEEDPRGAVSSIPSEVFGELSSLIDQTVHGTKLKQLRPRKKSHLFHTIEIQSEGGEVLGYLNMIYFKKPISGYYLVYVEVLPPFRGRGLGHQILKSFKEFAEASKAIGLLDNIIQPEDPTYTLYTKLGWKPIEELIGHGIVDQEGHYMVYIPESILLPNLKEKLVRFLFNVKKKRPVIDMQDNEAMVKRTIEEFRSVYEVLKQLFDKELSNSILTPFMCYMFTKFVTKVLGFHRRISKLIGYTGGESLDQISISDQIKDLPLFPTLYGVHRRPKSRSGRMKK